jgi:peptidylprolyl isomerase
MTYKGTLEDGTVFGFADADNPMVFQTGMDMVIDGLEKAVLELENVGDAVTVTVDQYDAYGEYLDDYTARIPRYQIPKDDLSKGKRIWLSSSEDGQPIPATVIGHEDDIVIFDLNHPLAGKDLTFEIEILNIEEPPEDFVSAAEKAKHLKEQSKLLGADQAVDYR